MKKTRGATIQEYAGFKVGGKVDAIGFKDSFGVDHPTRQGMVVESIEDCRETCPYAPHVRIKAVDARGGYFEGATRFFRLAEEA